MQNGQVFLLKATGNGGPSWAYRYRLGGRGARRVQRGGFGSEQAALEALERALTRFRREQGLVEAPTLAELVDFYLSQHDGSRRRSRSCAGCSAKRCASSGTFGSTSCSRQGSRPGG